MASWLQPFSTRRASPRLWIERLWLLESREPLAVVRIVDLHPGLNIVWAREPDSSTASGLASAGHGVGKTSLCLLLRYCLGDEAPSISALRDKALSGFPKGGVAAKVHVDGTAWLIYRPYGAHASSFAGRGESLESLLVGELEGDYPTFLTALHDAFIAKLPASTLPGSSQNLEWRHLLAWCIRDQKTRFDGFYHWRDGDGLGFRRPRQDPPLFVQTVLGLLDAEADGLMRAAEESQSELQVFDQQLAALEKGSVDEQAYRKRKLRQLLNVQNDIPVFETTDGPSFQSVMASALAEADRVRAALEGETERAEAALGPLLVQLETLRHEAEVRTKQREIAQSLLDANEAEYLRLATELQRLENIAGRCRHGDVEFSKCDYILRRQNNPSLPWRLSQQEAKASKPILQVALSDAQRLERESDEAARRQAAFVKEKRAELQRLHMRIGTGAAQREFLESLWGEFKAQVERQMNGQASQDIEDIRARREALVHTLNAKKADWVKRTQQRSERAETINSLTRQVAARLLGEEGYGRFVPDSDERPFGLLLGGEAYQVLEVLLGDLTCLLDAAFDGASHHPGFVVHDCPREADMSGRLYGEYLMAVAEVADAMLADGAVPFQYIVTTTSAPPAALQTERHVVLELFPGAEENLLFKRRLLPGLLE